MINRYFSLACASLLSCATPKIELSSDQPFEVRVINPADFSQESVSRDERVYTFETTKVRQKIIEAKVPGNDPVQYFILDGSESDILQLRVFAPKNDATPTTELVESHKSNPSLQFRLLLQAYEALVSEELPKARNLSEQLIAISPDIAAPHIILGLASIQENAGADALSHLNKAQALDPSDEKIQELIQHAESLNEQ